MSDYFDGRRTILLTTHQVEEVERVLTDLMFIHRGRIGLRCSMEEFETRDAKAAVTAEHLAEARALRPIHERPAIGRTMFIFDGVDREQLEAFAEVHTPSIADLFVAVIGSQRAESQGGRQ